MSNLLRSHSTRLVLNPTDLTVETISKLTCTGPRTLRQYYLQSAYEDPFAPGLIAGEPGKVHHDLNQEGEERIKRLIQEINRKIGTSSLRYHRLRHTDNPTLRSRKER